MNRNTAAKQQQTAVIYARVSSEEQVLGYSIQAQLGGGSREVILDDVL